MRGRGRGGWGEGGSRFHSYTVKTASQQIQYSYTATTTQNLIDQNVVMVGYAHRTHTAHTDPSKWSVSQQI